MADSSNSLNTVEVNIVIVKIVIFSIAKGYKIWIVKIKIIFVNHKADLCRNESLNLDSHMLQVG